MAYSSLLSFNNHQNRRNPKIVKITRKASLFTKKKKIDQIGKAVQEIETKKNKGRGKNKENWEKDSGKKNVEKRNKDLEGE